MSETLPEAQWKEKKITTDSYVLTIFYGSPIALHFVSRNRQEQIEFFTELKHEDLPKHLQNIYRTLDEFLEALGDSQFCNVDMDLGLLNITTYFITKHNKILRTSAIPLKRIQRNTIMNSSCPTGSSCLSEEVLLSRIKQLQEENDQLKEKQRVFTASLAQFEVSIAQREQTIEKKLLEKFEVMYANLENIVANVATRMGKIEKLYAQLECKLAELQIKTERVIVDFAAVKAALRFRQVQRQLQEVQGVRNKESHPRDSKIKEKTKISEPQAEKLADKPFAKKKYCDVSNAGDNLMKMKKSQKEQSQEKIASAAEQTSEPVKSLELTAAIPIKILQKTSEQPQSAYKIDSRNQNKDLFKIEGKKISLQNQKSNNGEWVQLVFEEPISKEGRHYYFKILQSQTGKVVFGITDRLENIRRKSSQRVHKSVLTYEGQTGIIRGSFGESRGDKFAEGDVVSVYVNSTTGHIKFFKNSELVAESILKEIKDKRRDFAPFLEIFYPGDAVEYSASPFTH